jgi:phospholipid-binding lipoprotein MlaA
MKLLFFFLTVILFTFQGCATNNKAAADLNQPHNKTEVAPSDTIPNAVSDQQDEQDPIEEFEEEFSFEEEFATEETSTPSDPLSGYNKVMTSFNDLFITYLLTPVSEGYAAILPEPFRIGISNAFDNIQFPIRFTNNLLQLKLANSSDELKRFVVNSTIGLGGLMDPAKKYMHIYAHEEDFGQTLGHYGVGSGFHIVLPFVGPSNVRDVVGLTVDAYASPLVYTEGLENYKIPDNRDHSIAILTGEMINKTSLHLGEYESLKQDAIQFYQFLRDTYEQKRNSDIAE